MKISKLFLCSTLLSSMGTALAGVQTVIGPVIGTLDGMNVVGATADPVLTVTPSKPTFALRI